MELPELYSSLSSGDLESPLGLSLLVLTLNKTCLPSAPSELVGAIYIYM